MPHNDLTRTLESLSRPRGRQGIVNFCERVLINSFSVSAAQSMSTSECPLRSESDRSAASPRIDGVTLKHQATWNRVKELSSVGVR